MTPLASEKVIRGILKTLVHQGLLASTVDTDALEALPVNATEADINTVVNAFLPGSVPIAGANTPNLLSNTDMTAWIDADSTLGPHEQFFRVGMRGTDQSVDVGEFTELFTVSRYYQNPSTASTSVIIGPKKSFMANNATDITGFAANLNTGTFWDTVGGNQAYFGTILGSSLALTDYGWGTAGLKLSSPREIEIRSKDYTIFTSSTGAVQGGFYNYATTPTLLVGAYPTSALIDALTISQIAGTHSFQVQVNHSTAHNILYINSTNATYNHCTSINGIPAVGAVGFKRDPSDHVYPVFSVFGTGIDDHTVALLKTNQTNYIGTVLRILHSEGANPNFDFIKCENWAGPGEDIYNGCFRVDGAGVVRANAFTPPYADLAEWMLTDAPHDAGSVLILRDGIAVLSDGYEATGVVGVVSTQPGIILNGICEGKEHHVRVAKSGMVPVFFSTEFGDVDGNGELICAGPGGYAVRAPEHPRPGSIVGKAASKLHRAADGSVVVGVITAVVG